MLRGFNSVSKRYVSTSAVATAAAPPPTIPRPANSILLGDRLFDNAKARALMPSEAYEALVAAQQVGKPVSKQHANMIASAISTWATQEHGAVAFAHYFSPIRNAGYGGGRGLKHDSLIDYNNADGSMSWSVSGGPFFHGETDGSSFPNGGLRQTHVAGAHTAWDTTSPPFVRDGTLYLPSVFFSHDGDGLDEKTLLLRSEVAVAEQALRVLRALGDKTSVDVESRVGWEQEFFVIDRDNFVARPDLVHTGRVLIGAPPFRNQQTSQQYFGAIPRRAYDMLTDVRSELWSLGTPIDTLHNEVAPAQHETASVFAHSPVAVDRNHVCMEVINDISAKHGLVTLWHEKPFAGINGSGKHANWSLHTNNGDNLFNFGESQFEQERAMVFGTAVIAAVAKHGDLIRAGIATPGNDFRLGAQEAPPAIISVAGGAEWASHLDKVMDSDGELAGFQDGKHRVNCGVKRGVPPFHVRSADRNRTTPMPFIGNRYEMRGVGSSQSVAWPVAAANIATADGLKDIADLLDSGMNMRDAVAETLRESRRALYHGDGYSEGWVAEAESRGLPNLRTTGDAVQELVSEKNKALFSDHGVMTPEALTARATIMAEEYNNSIETEAATILDMARTGALPAIAAHSITLKDAGLDNSSAIAQANALTGAVSNLETILAAEPASDAITDATRYAYEVRGAVAQLSSAAEAIEGTVSGESWPWPKVDEIVYSHHF